MIEISAQLIFKDYYSLEKYVKNLNTEQKNDFLCLVFQLDRMASIPKKHVLEFYSLFNVKAIKAALTQQFSLRKLLRRLPIEQRKSYLFDLAEVDSLQDLITDDISLIGCLKAFDQADRDCVINIINPTILRQCIRSLEDLLDVSKLLSVSHQYIFWKDHQKWLESYLENVDDLTVLLNSVSESSIRYFLLKILSGHIRKIEMPVESALYLIKLLDKSDRLAALKIVGHAITRIDQLQQYKMLALFNPDEVSILLKANTESINEAKRSNVKIKLFKPAVIPRQSKQEYVIEETQQIRPT